MHVDRMSRLRPQAARALTETQPPPAGAALVPAPAVRPPVPACPAEVSRCLESGVRDRRFLFPEHGGSRMVEDWRAPSVPEGPLLDEARAHLAELEAFLEPAERGALLARVLALLSHFRSEANPPQVEQMIADDWAEDLAGFPMWAVEDACRTWRRKRKWRPQICEILALCATAVGDAAVRRDRLRALVDRARMDANPLAGRMLQVAASTFRRVPS